MVLMQPSKSDTTRILYSPAEAAEALSIGRTTLFKLIHSGALKARKIGKRTVITHDDLVAFAKGLSVAR